MHHGYPHASLDAEYWCVEECVMNNTVEGMVVVSPTPSHSWETDSDSLGTESALTLSYPIGEPPLTSNHQVIEHGPPVSTNPLEANVSSVSDPHCSSPTTTTGGSSADNSTDFSRDPRSRRSHWRQYGTYRPSHLFLVLASSFGVVVLIACAILLTTFIINLTTESPGQSSAIPVAESNSSTIETQNDLFLRLRDTFRQYSDPTTFLVPRSPQSRALNWFYTIPQDPTLWDEDKDTSRLAQRYALIIVSLSCSGDSWFNVEMLDVIATQHECDWPYVTCNQDRIVTRLDLDRRDLIGSIPEEVGALTGLRVLSAAGNRFEGSLLPLSVYAKLTSLEHIFLGHNAISFSIPTEIGLLSDSLTMLDFSGNFVTGNLPHELKALSKLSFVDMTSNVELKGTIFDFLPFWPGLEELYIGETGFTGSMAPETIEVYMTSLKGLDVRTLPQFPSIPTTIGLLTNLEQLYFGSDGAITPMHGSIPTEIGLLRSLKSLLIDDTNIAGTIPTEVGLLSDLTLLVFLNCQLTSTIPSKISMLSNLQDFVVSGNRLSGTVPSEMGRLSELSSLVIEGNLLMVIPPQLCRPDVMIIRGCDQLCSCCDSICYLPP